MAGRVSELMALADGGSEEAISDLFKEFGIEYEPKEIKAGGGQVGYMGGGHVKMKGYTIGGSVGYSMAGTGAALKGKGCRGLF